MADAADHSQLMDQTYRYQRLIYDVTRKYYLLGRDHMIAEMKVQPGQRVLEVACGTGRNLAKIGKHYPEAQLYGMDISEEMLITARANLGAMATLAQGDACQFDPESMFGVQTFDHIVLSYSLSMIPDWNGALSQAAHYIAPGGTLHVVDFGDSAQLPGWFQRMLLAWLARFHVTPRRSLGQSLNTLMPGAKQVTVKHLFRRYSIYGRLSL